MDKRRGARDERRLAAQAASDVAWRMASEIVVVGSFNQDLTWRCGNFPAAGETVVGTFATGPGGKGCNQAVAAARAGARVAWVGALGGDAFGHGAEKFLRAEGVAVRAVRKKFPTGTAAILVDARGQNRIVVALGANAALAPRDVPTALLRGARVVVCQHETNLVVHERVFRTARRAGATTVLNPAPMRADFDAAVLAHVDVLIPNESEFVALANLVAGTSLTEAALAALSDEKLHEFCRELRVPVVIVTLGARGCLVSQRTGFAVIPAHRVQAIDTTGAGDAFVGGFAAGLVKFSGDLAAAARFANAVAALSVTKPGTAPSMPTAREITAFLKARN